jgi:hypothetical protein
LTLLLVVVLVLVLGYFGDFEDEDENEKDALVAGFLDRLQPIEIVADRISIIP